MGYTLYGSQTSPFVRRIRILLENIEYDLKEINIFEGQDAVDLNKVNPINQVPVLVDGENTIWDSRVIFNYLNSKHQLQAMDWKDENLVTAIDGAMSSGVSLYMMKRSGINIVEPFMHVVRQKDRIESILDYLKPYLLSDAAKEWNFQSISLFCFLDWASYRGIISLESRPECSAFLENHNNRLIVVKTAIPKV